jgi:hypothetical protein
VSRGGHAGERNGQVCRCGHHKLGHRDGTGLCLECLAATAPGQGGGCTSFRRYARNRYSASRTRRAR